MKEFLIYFFGQGTTQEFALFTPAHILPIAWMIAMILLIRKNADKTHLAEDCTVICSDFAEFLRTRRGRLWDLYRQW